MQSDESPTISFQAHVIGGERAATDVGGTDEVENAVNVFCIVNLQAASGWEWRLMFQRDSKGVVRLFGRAWCMPCHQNGLQ